MDRYRLTFDFIRGAEAAQKRADEINKAATPYLRKKKKAAPLCYDGNDLFIIWYYMR